jgi:nucleoside-diphosphate-sugar epimerase
LKLIVTGANGFVGSRLVERLSALERLPSSSENIIEIAAVDTQPLLVNGPRVKPYIGNLTDGALRDALFAQPVDVLFHLAAIPGGLAAADYQLGWQVNVETTIMLFEQLALQSKPPRVVFSSSIGVFGVPLPTDKVDDDTLPVPTMSYGTQKLIVESLLADFSRRKLIDGPSLRLPGVVARPRQAGGHLSAYMSNIFHALAAGEAFTCPISAKGASWLMSRECCVDNLIHAASLPVDIAYPRRSFCLPALRLSMDELVGAHAAQFGAAVKNLVTYAPNPDLELQFASYPPLLTPIANALGFLHDGDSATLVRRALALPRDRAS